MAPSSNPAASIGPGLMVNQIFSEDVFSAASGAYRDRAMAGVLHSE